MIDPTKLIQRLVAYHEERVRAYLMVLEDLQQSPMPTNKRLTRKYRRRAKAGLKSGHQLVGGRTGSVRSKQRAGMLKESRKRR